MLQLNSEQYMMPYPLLADGSWHSVGFQIDTEYFNFTVDHLYKKVFKFSKFKLIFRKFRYEKILI